MFPPQARENWRPILLLFLICLLTRLPSLYTPIIDIDESIFAICGETIRQGGKLYLDCADHQPPGIYWMFGTIFSLFGANNMLAVHALTLLIVFFTALALWWILGGRAGFWSALFYVLFSTTHIPKYISTNIEIIANLPLVLAFGLVLQVRPKWMDLRHLLAGALAAVAVLLKYQVLILLGPVVLFLLMTPRRFFLLLTGGVLATGGAMLLLHWNGTLTAFYTETLVRGWNYATLGGATISFWKNLVTRMGLTVGFFSWLWWFAGRGIVDGFRACPEWAATGGRPYRPWIILLWLLGSFLAVLAGARFYPHYFILMLPPLCLLAGAPAAHFWRRSEAPPVTAEVIPGGTEDLSDVAIGKSIFSRGSGGRGPATGGSWRQWGEEFRRARKGLPLPLHSAYFLMLILWGVFFLLPRVNFQRSYQWFYQNHANLDAGTEPMLHEDVYRSVGEYIEQHSVPSDRIVVWGFSTPIYFFANRLSASREIWSDDLTGRVPGSPRAWQADFDTTPYIRPGSWQSFLQELQQNRPLWFVDTATASLNYYGKYPIQKYPPLWEFLQAHYAPELTISGVQLYRLK